MMQYSNPYSFEKTDVRGQKINKILHLTYGAMCSLCVGFERWKNCV